MTVRAYTSLMSETNTPTPTPEAIEELANRQVQNRIETGKKLAATLRELSEARALVTELEDRYKTDYDAAITSSWTAPELSSIGIDPVKPKRSRRAGPKTSRRTQGISISNKK
ncbi:hypothetical protein DBV08_30700 [Rhodococcus sp. KBW08]|nr:hypothetical protein DBV08_30700 [Rhodococcus sp. KBW08]